MGTKFTQSFKIQAVEKAIERAGFGSGSQCSMALNGAYFK